MGWLDLLAAFIWLLDVALSVFHLHIRRLTCAAMVGATALGAHLTMLVLAGWTGGMGYDAVPSVILAMCCYAMVVDARVRHGVRQASPNRRATPSNA